VRLGSRGQRNLDDGDQAITDDVEKAAVRKQANKVLVKSVIAGVVLTLVAFVA
jgi:hypothetical protein